MAEDKVESMETIDETATESTAVAAAAAGVSDKESASDAKKPDGKKNLDLAFAMDCTGSMGSYIHQAQQNIRRISEDIVAAEQADIQLALVEYRDHPPQDSSFVTRVHDFTTSVRDMKSWLDGCSANGGGDAPEAVADALHQLLKLNWRENSTKICVFIADAPPHGLCQGGSDGFPNGCPQGLDPMEIANQLAAKAVTIYMVGCEPSILPYKEWFSAVAHITGGQYVPLKSAALLSKVITAGAEEELSLQALMDEINAEVVQEFSATGGPVDEAVLSSKIHTKLASKGTRAKKLQMNQMDLAKPTVQAQKLAEYRNMSEVKKNFSSAPPAGGIAMRSSVPSARSFASPPPAVKSARKKKAQSASLSSRIRSVFGGSSEAADGSCEVADYEGDISEVMCAAPPLSREDEYAVAEDVVSDYQVQRMVSKSINSNMLRAKVKGKKMDD